MEEELIEFTKSQNFTESLDQLKQLLKKESQILYFDQLYNKLENSEELKSKGYGTIQIDGLENVFRLFILSIYYRNLLYPNKIDTNGEELNRVLIYMYNDDKNLKMNLNNLLYLMNIVLGVVAENDKNFNHRLNYELNHHIHFNSIYDNSNYLPGYYLIIDDNSITIDETVDAVLNDKKFKKIFIAINLFKAEKGPHINRYSSQLYFYLHDCAHFSHFKILINKMNDNDSLDIFTSLYNNCKVNKRSFIHRYISSLFFYVIHESDHFYRNSEVMIEEIKKLYDFDELDYEKLICKFFDSFDKSYFEVDDLKHILKYIIRATDYEVSIENKEIFDNAFTFENKEYVYGLNGEDKHDYATRKIIKNGNKLLDDLKYVFLLLSRDFLDKVKAI